MARRSLHQGACCAVTERLCPEGEMWQAPAAGLVWAQWICFKINQQSHCGAFENP
jgi:hypothetical protein